MPLLRILRYLLAPFALIYSLVVCIRNACYEHGLFSSVSFPLPVIAVGNITVGGTGKTPLIEYLLRLLSGGSNMAVVSRGYRRKSRGLVMATPSSTAAELGDEPWQMMRRFPGVRFVADADRCEAIERLMESDIKPKVDAVLLDDAMQYRRVRPGMLIMLTDYSHPIYSDYPFPMGLMREPSAARRRADIIIVTKCPPALTRPSAQSIIRRLSPRPGQRVFFSTIAYGRPYNIFTHEETEMAALLAGHGDVIALAGIARPRPFFERVKSFAPAARNIALPDHHSFTASELEELRKFALSSKSPLIITTEKDASRLYSRLEKGDSRIRDTIYALPIRAEFLFEEQETFNKIILDYVRRNK